MKHFVTRVWMGPPRKSWRLAGQDDQGRETEQQRAARLAKTYMAVDVRLESDHSARSAVIVRWRKGKRVFGPKGALRRSA